MRKLMILLGAVLLCACSAPGAEGVNPEDPRAECMAIAAELADTVRHMRLVSHDPPPATVDMAIEQARDFDECMADLTR